MLIKASGSSPRGRGGTAPCWVQLGLHPVLSVSTGAPEEGQGPLSVTVVGNPKLVEGRWATPAYGQGTEVPL